MRAIAGPGHVSNEFADYDATTNPNGTVVTAAWANDVQDELLGIQDDAGIAQAAGTNEYILAAIKYEAIRYSSPLGALVSIPGNAKAPAAFDKDAPGDFFPAFCATNIDGDVTSIDVANYPDLVPHLRSQQFIYLEGKTGETSTFGGTVSGSTFTLTSNTANDDVILVLNEMLEDYYARSGSYAGYLTLDIGGTTYEIADQVNTATRAITLTGTPGDGAATATIYPHRIAGSTTTARVHSLSGKSAVGAGTTEIMSMILRRDRMQRITGDIGGDENTPINEFVASSGAFSIAPSDANNRPAFAELASTNKIVFDSADSPDARTSPATDTTDATHPSDYGAHVYYWAGRYLV